MSSSDQSMGCTRPHAACWPLLEASHCRGRHWSTRLLTMPRRKASGIHMPTDARPIRPDVIYRLAAARVAIFNLAVDAVEEMNESLSRKVGPWNCRAGQNSLIIRVDGILAPMLPHVLCYA